MSALVNDNADSEELEALFDSIVEANRAASGELNAGQGGASAAEPDGQVYRQIGQLTRKLHDALQELGYDKSLEKAAAAIPDARDRLAYVAELTERAAERTLTAAEAAKPIQQQISDSASRLSSHWQRLYDQQLSVDEFKQLATETKEFLKAIPDQAKAINGQLMEIIVAQDFQDLTGQVITKIVGIAENLESQLLQLLVSCSPEGTKTAIAPGLLHGPVTRAAQSADVVASQQQVDELLESLGF